MRFKWTILSIIFQNHVTVLTIKSVYISSKRPPQQFFRKQDTVDKYEFCKRRYTLTIPETDKNCIPTAGNIGYIFLNMGYTGYRIFINCLNLGYWTSSFLIDSPHTGRISEQTCVLPCKEIRQCHILSATASKKFLPWGRNEFRLKIWPKHQQRNRIF